MLLLQPVEKLLYYVAGHLVAAEIPIGTSHYRSLIRGGDE
jgi:hypothetical protein